MIIKKRATAAEIRTEIQNRIQESKDMGGDCRECVAPTPRPAAPMDNEGCNWTIDFLPSRIPGCEKFVLMIVKKTMGEYDLISG
jgi:hypothetical protein